MQVIFQRNNTYIQAKIIKTVTEPLDSKGRQVVFFCQDSAGNRYRVPKSQLIGKAAPAIAVKESKKAKKARMKRRDKKCKRTNHGSFASL